jgi:hypothetical protein
MIERESLFHPDWAIVKRPEIALLIIFGSFIVASLLFQLVSFHPSLYDLVKSPALENLVLLGVLFFLALQVHRQNKSMRQAEYLRLRGDFSDVTKALIHAGRHEDVYNELARRTRRRLIGWNGYSRPERITYLYMEQMYELLERVFEMREKGWIDEEEWELWERWIDDMGYHPLFSHVYEDNKEMFPRAFEDYIRTRLLVAGTTGTFSSERGQEESLRPDREHFAKKTVFEDRDR